MSIVGIGLVMRWMAINDRVAPDQPTTGLFAMLETARRRLREERTVPEPDAHRPAAKRPDARRQRQT
ncbi:MAG TPA: hypothetical protein VFN42_13960 [Acetobacteraceae bacterium]|nr:hypothetical protein [Acetobacteraceae bacterium]